MASSAKCGVCNKNVTKSDFGVRCICCRIWFHTVCANISSELYALLGGKNTNLTFTCSGCLANPTSKEDKSEMRQCIEELDKKISANFNAFTAELRG